MVEQTSSFQEELDHVTLRFDEELDRDVSRLLKKTKLTISVAESLTGGLIGSRLTRLPGSSSYFVGGVVCYQPKIKIDLCGVSASTIRKEGVVSRAVALEMARGVKQRMKSDLSISATGAAGPADVQHPAEMTGHLFLGFSLKEGGLPEGNSYEEAKHYHFPGSRETVRQKASQAALTHLRQYLLNSTTETTTTT